MENLNNTRTATREKTVGLVQMAIFSAIICVLAFTPFIGYIPLGFTRATIIHVPVIIGSLMLGPKKGAVLGGVFGFTSFLYNTMNPTITSFVFTPFYSLGEFSGGIGSLVICFIPRILIGIVPYYVYMWVKKLSDTHKDDISTIGLTLAGIAGSLTNTILVMGLIYILFGESYAAAKEVTIEALLGVIMSVVFVNGIPEAIVAAVIVTLAGKTLLKKSMKKLLGV